MLNRTVHMVMVLLSTSLLFTVPTYAKTPFLADSLGEEEIIHLQIPTNAIGKFITPLEQSMQEYKLQKEKLKQKEELKKQLEEEQERKRKQHEQNFVVSYYGATYNECGNNHFITASGVPVQAGHIAAPKEIPFGSKVILNGTEYVVADRGNPKYICILDDGSIKIDVFVPRLNGESTKDYETRINNMGIDKVVGELYINN